MESTKNKLLSYLDISDKNEVGEKLNPIDKFLYEHTPLVPMREENRFREDLIKALNYETEEDKMFRNGEVIASFIEHCEENGLEIPLSFYESYFGA